MGKTYKHQFEELDDTDDEIPSKRKQMDPIKLPEICALLQEELHKYLKSQEKNEINEKKTQENHDDENHDNNDDENLDETRSPQQSKKDSLVDNKSLLETDLLLSKSVVVSTKIKGDHESVYSSQR